MELHLYSFAERTYRDESLNRMDYVATAKALAPTRIVKSESYDEGDTVFFRVVARPSERGIDLSRAIKDTFTRGGCSHDYDCCGCASSYARVKRISAREYKVRVSTSYNY